MCMGGWGLTLNNHICPSFDTFSFCDLMRADKHTSLGANISVEENMEEEWWGQAKIGTHSGTEVSGVQK